MDIDRYLERIGFEGRPGVDLESLETLQRAHMTAVPFENLDVYNKVPVRTDLGWSVPKVVERRRGGWCFELNGAFGALLEALGFPVTRLGAAVLLAGPATQITHLALEVQLDQPYLVDVGFGEGFIRPLALNQAGPQDGGVANFELMRGDQGTTLTRYVGDGPTAAPEPAAQYRFKRVALRLDDLEPGSAYLQNELSLPWHKRGFATRLLDGGPDRVTLVGNQLKLQQNGSETETAVADADWVSTLQHWFGLLVEPLGGPTRPDAPDPA